MSKFVAAAEFEANCLALLDEVAETQEDVVVLKEGKPFAKVIPAERRVRRTLEELRGSGRILGDIMEPLDEWDMMK